MRAAANDLCTEIVWSAVTAQVEQPATALATTAAL